MVPARCSRFNVVSKLGHIAIAISSFLILPSGANAGSVYGRITDVAVSESGNYAFRVFISGLSGCAYNFVYVETSDTNYTGYMNFLLSVYNAGRSISIQYDVDPGGFCKINYATT